MADFSPINTQEELDQLIAPRLQREREKAVKPFADYDQIKNDLAAANKALGEKDATIADLNTQLKSARTDLAKTRIALDKKLPLEVVAALKGETEEELKGAAEALASYMSAGGRGAEPARSTEPVQSGVKLGGVPLAGMQELLNNLNLGGN